MQLTQEPQTMTTTDFITDYDLYLLREGKHLQMYNKMGAHYTEDAKGNPGVHFCLWAPNAKFVSVIGDFNGWNRESHPMENLKGSGYWAAFIPWIENETSYKFYIQSGTTHYEVEKSDPMGFFAEARPCTASKTWDINSYTWNDKEWMSYRNATPSSERAISIYECHLGSWMRIPEEGNRWLSYTELADRLVNYVKSMNFTHVEFMPISEHPYDLSWGYQAVGYFAPTSRFGSPDEFKFLVDKMHQNNIGVLVDWVPAHFPKDLHGLDFFDGTHLYEHSDWRKREHKDWGTNIFNYGRWEVKNFLISNALFWLDKYHIDGLRVDAVASMLYLDYSRKEGEWEPNIYGGRENLEAIDFLRDLNDAVHHYFPDALTFAEESTSWGGVTKPTSEGGLGFDYKWDMGWMHDSLEYFQKDPIHRSHHQSVITFRGLYMFSEKFCLPLSHDEVVHGKKSILSKMPGDMWQQFANARALYAYQWAQPGKKLLFMGCEIGQWHEWNCEQSVDWHLKQWESHEGLQTLISDLNALYSSEPALHDRDTRSDGYYMIDCQDSQNSVMAFGRRGNSHQDDVIVVCNFTPTTHYNYRVGVPYAGQYTELMNTDASEYGGSGQLNSQLLNTEQSGFHGQDQSIQLTLPPLGITFLKKI